LAFTGRLAFAGRLPGGIGTFGRSDLLAARLHAFTSGLLGLKQSRSDLQGLANRLIGDLLLTAYLLSTLARGSLRFGKGPSRFRQSLRIAHRSRLLTGRLLASRLLSLRLLTGRLLTRRLLASRLLSGWLLATGLLTGRRFA
jgi:hypothetical protein